MNLNNQLKHLISQILKTTNEKTINNFCIIANDFITAPITLSKPKSIQFWQRCWKSQVNEAMQKRLDFTCRKIPNKKMQIFKLLNDLKGTCKCVVLNKSVRDSNVVCDSSFSSISEEEIVFDLLTLLQC